jgi:pilus assembly protein TadC
MVQIPFVEDFGKAFTPKRFRPKLKRYLECAGVYSSPYELIGNLFYVSLVFTFAIIYLFINPLVREFTYGMSFAVSSLAQLGLIFVSFAVISYSLMVFFFLIGYFFLDIRIYKRIINMEENLPDFLVLVSTNLKGGMNVESALWNSIKPKFGVLAEEITLVSKKVMTGYDVAEALAELHDKYNSPELKRTLNLIVSELEIGGRITKIIDDIIAQLTSTRKLKKKMVSSVLSYIIFISAITLCIAPFLFALSYNLVNFIYQFVSKIGGSMAVSASVPTFLANMKPSSIDPEMFKYFGYFTVGTIAVFSSVIVSIIEKGDIKGGLKYMPIFIVVSLSVYSLGLFLLGLVLGGIVI